MAPVIIDTTEYRLLIGLQSDQWGKPFPLITDHQERKQRIGDSQSPYLGRSARSATCSETVLEPSTDKHFCVAFLP